MRILALEPYYGGSHKAFIDGWSAISRHDWTVLELPAHKWKWRMRHSAVTFADEVSVRAAHGQEWDLVFCSDMLNLAEFLGLVPPGIRQLPAVIYLHENQLTYPVRFETERDYQFAVTNMTSALAADSVWFNSAFHRDSFLDALQAFLGRMPDYQPTEAVARIRSKTLIHPPGVSVTVRRGQRKPGPVRVLWAARWEHDKNPQDFFEALKILESRGIGFRLSVIGEQFREAPEVFEWARQHFAEHIDRWGFQRSRADYEGALAEADVFVSTAEHEFFGITAVEATLAGAYPVLPRRLAYPEIFELSDNEAAGQFFYDGSAAGLADRLMALAARAKQDSLWGEAAERAARPLQRFRWDTVAQALDDVAKQVRARHRAIRV